jgi:hypothetical protein
MVHVISLGDVPVVLNLGRYENDDWAIELQLNEVDGSAHDASASTVTALAEDNTGTTTLLNVDDSDGSSGMIDVTGDLPAAVYLYSITEVASDGRTTTWLRGQLTIDAALITATG